MLVVLTTPRAYIMLHAGNWGFQGDGYQFASPAITSIRLNELIDDLASTTCRTKPDPSLNPSPLIYNLQVQGNYMNPEQSDRGREINSLDNIVSCGNPVEL